MARTKVKHNWKYFLERRLSAEQSVCVKQQYGPLNTLHGWILNSVFALLCVRKLFKLPHAFACLICIWTFHGSVSFETVTSLRFMFGCWWQDGHLHFTLSPSGSWASRWRRWKQFWGTLRKDHYQDTTIFLIVEATTVKYIQTNIDLQVSSIDHSESSISESCRTSLWINCILKAQTLCLV